MLLKDAHPTKARVQAVVERLRDYAAHRAGGEATAVALDAKTIRREGCDLVADVAGHYLASYVFDTRERIGERAAWRSERPDGVPTLVDTLVNARGEPYGFTAGTRLLARDLGFASVGDLLAWADANPALWGNAVGGHMFCGAQSPSYSAGGALAYAKDDETAADWERRRKAGEPTALTLADVIAQWERVRDRLPA